MVEPSRAEDTRRPLTGSAYPARVGLVGLDEAEPEIHETGSVRRHATKDHAEVCPVSRGVMFQPLSGPLQPGIRFLCDPIPAPPTARLAAHLPRGQQYGLTTFPICHTTGLGPAYSPVVLRRRIPIIDRDNRPRTFWLLPNSSFGNLIITTFISSSLTLPMPASLAPQPGTAPSIHGLPHGRTAPSRGLHCRESFTPHRYQ